MATAPLVLLLLAGSLRADDLSESARLLRELEQEYRKEAQAFQKALAQATTPQAKAKIAREKAPRHDRYALRFLDLARKYPRSAAAVDALVWVVLHPTPPAPKGDDPRTRALEVLRARHADSDRLGPLCTQLVFDLGPASEALLRAVLRKTATAAVEARACTSLAQNLKFRAREIARLRDDPDRIKALEAALGKRAAGDLAKRDPKKLLAESEKLFQTVIDKHGKVAHPSHGTLANLARSNLQAIGEPVTVGKLAPGISRAGVDGKTLTLLDYRGKVVLIDFWAELFDPCRDAYPVERALVKRYAERPFALVGVNGDGTRQEAQRVRAREKQTWPSWYDGLGGPIATRWEVERWPTLYLLDKKGVVRQTWFGWPPAKVLHQAIDRLLKESAKGS
jgi:thiol-disulfide isomerase/thioredoxin